MTISEYVSFLQAIEGWKGKYFAAERQLAETRKETIEECARVASCYSPSPWEPEAMRNGIVAQIRALKPGAHG